MSALLNQLYYNPKIGFESEDKLYHKESNHKVNINYLSFFYIRYHQFHCFLYSYKNYK